MEELIREVIDYSCIIRLWKSKGYCGETIYFQTIHPKWEKQLIKSKQ